MPLLSLDKAYAGWKAERGRATVVWQGRVQVLAWAQKTRIYHNATSDFGIPKVPVGAEHLFGNDQHELVC